MDEIALNSKNNTRILLARNKPVALVVGASSFLGSHLVDKLLIKDIQVLGVDDLVHEKKGNLSKATENKNFHLIIEKLENLELEVEKIDYIIISSEYEINLKKVLELFKKHKCRLLFISSVELYNQDDIPDNLKWLKHAESDIAKYAQENKLNARILRLGPIFGPRMTFKNPDPLARLIHQSLSGDLQKEISLEFSSRALFVQDAVDLCIKCIFAGATAQKIFDGVLPTPVKVSEIKQILLDPIWYENKQFRLAELPPWPTPNLEKTINQLDWHPKKGLVEALRITLSDFRDNEQVPFFESGIKVPELETGKWKMDGGKEWKEEKKEDLEKLKEEKQEIPRVKPKKGINFAYSKILQILILIFVFYALIWPAIELGWGVLTFRFQLSEAVKNLEKGEFDKSLGNINQASAGVYQAKSIFNSLEPIRSAGVLNSQFELGDSLSSLASLSSDSAKNTILGIQALYQSLKAVTGESNESPKKYFDQASIYLASADEDLSKAYALLNDEQFKKKVPAILKSRVDSLRQRLSTYSDLVKKARALSSLLPDVVALDSAKSYLVLLQNNMELRPTGGFIGSFAKVLFESGKLKKLEVNDIYAIDGALKIHVEPPKEIKEDLGQKDFFLRDSNWEPDFPTSARQAQWFYTKETGERVEGVIGLDVSAVEDLLSVLGPIDLPDYSEKISSDNLFEKAISHAESNFFPGTQAKKSFLTALTQGVFNKLFFLPNQNWPQVVSSLGRSLERKHMSVYLDNPRLFSYLVSQNWAAVLPRAGEKTKGVTSDFLAPVEANLGANKANYYLDRSYSLETTIGKDGEIRHRLRISYTNRSPSDAFPGGKYKNRMRVYLPFGTKLDRVLFSESDITRNVTSFVDYGRIGFSFLLELLPKEQKTLVLDYQTPEKLSFDGGKAIYKLDVVKQAGTLKDPFIWKIAYPLNMKLGLDQAKRLGPQEYSIQTDLSKDRSFELTFQKN